MRKVMNNNGLPLSVDAIKDLPRKMGIPIESWYVKADFESDGHILGFTWHQGMFYTPDGKEIVSAETVFMDATEDIWINKELTASASSENNCSYDELNVYSSWGSLKGNRDAMSLTLDLEENKLDIKLTPQEEVLYNGASGLITFNGTPSYQYSFPNMKMEGTFTIKGKTYEVKNGTAWFDRQMGKVERPDILQEGANLDGTLVPGKSTWLWLGLALGEDRKEAISLWDIYSGNTRYAFATIADKFGAQTNAVADITYDEVWTSSKTRNKYPKVLTIKVAAVDFEIKLTSYSNSENVEFVRDMQGLSGCQCLYRGIGTYKGQKIDRTINLELIGNLCE